jgi:hypothetical protein
MGVLSINRTEPFDMARFAGPPSSARRLANNGGSLHCSHWRIVNEVGSIALTELDTSKLFHGRFVSESDPGRWTTRHEEYVRRMASAGYMPLDAQVLNALLENQDLIPASWKELRFIRFDGTLLKDEYGRERVLCLAWYGYGDWSWTTFECRNWGLHSGLLRIART